MQITNPTEIGSAQDRFSSPAVGSVLFPGSPAPGNGTQTTPVKRKLTFGLSAVPQPAQQVSLGGNPVVNQVATSSTDETGNPVISIITTNPENVVKKRIVVVRLFANSNIYYYFLVCR